MRWNDLAIVQRPIEIEDVYATSWPSDEIFAATDKQDVVAFIRLDDAH